MISSKLSPSATMSLEAVIGRLSQHPSVIGILLDGSVVTGNLTPASDYDIVIVMDTLDLPINVGVTVIDNRPADIIFLLAEHIHDLMNAQLPVNPHSINGHVLRRLRHAKVAYDRDGILQSAVDKANQSGGLTPLSQQTAYSAWFSLNFNLEHLRLLRNGEDEVRRITAEIRLTIYGAPELLWHYFAIRRIVWSGEKDAVRYLQQHDPDYLAQYMNFLREPDLDTKFALYETLVEHASAPMGGRWQAGHTYWQINQDVEIDADLQSRLNEWWIDLLGATS